MVALIDIILLVPELMQLAVKIIEYLFSMMSPGNIFYNKVAMIRQRESLPIYQFKCSSR